MEEKQAHPDTDSQTAGDPDSRESGSAPFGSRGEDPVRDLLARAEADRAIIDAPLMATLKTALVKVFSHANTSEAIRLRINFTIMLFGILMPPVCFAYAAFGVHQVDNELWQDGNFSTYCSLLLEWPSAIGFYPAYLYSWGCLLLWFLDSERFGKLFAIRIGIYAGVLLSLQACVLAYAPGTWEDLFAGFVAIVTVSAIVLSCVYLALIPCYAILQRMTDSQKRIASMVLLSLWILSAAFAAFVPPVALCFLLLASVSAPIAIFCYLWSSAVVATGKNGLFRFSILRLLGITTWISAYLGGWQTAIYYMMQEYEKLPEENPNCFVTAAAAHGHRTVVKPVAVEHAGGGILVSRQMQVFKAGEFALAAGMPRLHRMIRSVYNRIGPVLASRIIKSRWLATFAWLILKPFEWSTCMVLRVIGIERSLVERIYL